jgi:CHASE2 domain-containing sensor protein/signal transduction histidine kinase
MSANSAQSVRGGSGALGMNPARLMVEWAILLALAITAALYSQSSDWTARVDNQLLDFGASLTRPPLDPDIVLVTIDDESLAQVGAWPWPRDLHAQLIDRLERDGARLIVLDILFPEPGDTQADEALARAIERSGKVVLPHSFVARPNTLDAIDPLWPIPALRTASAGVGHVDAAPDPDGVLRRFALAFRTSDDAFPHAALRALEATGADASEWLAQDQPVIIPFRSESEFPRQRASAVLDGSTLPGFFKDKIVLVGATAPGLGDQFSVATSPVQIMSGLGTQANLLAALRAEATITPVSGSAQGLVAVILLTGLFLAFWYLAPRYVLLCAAGAALCVLVASVALLGSARLWFEPASIIAAILLAYPLWSWRRLSHVSRYLDREADRLDAEAGAAVADQGFDYVTAQVEKLRRLIRTVRGSLAFLEQVIEAAPDAIVVLDARGQVEMLNQKAAQVFPEWKAGARMAFADALEASGAQLEKDGSELVSASGQIYLIARAAIASPDSAGPAGEIIALRDVSDLRRLDNERQQMLEFLSHDMRTPQVAIVGLTEQAEAGSVNRDTVARIRSQAERTLKLADDFVQLARLNTPQLAREDSDIGALIEEACDRAYAPARLKRITLDQALPEEPCFAVVDASLIARMLDNLIGNAIKYSGTGTRVLISLEEGDAGALTMVVRDEGPGLPPERLEKPFARFGAHSTHAGPSSGLGLAFVKRAVDLHDGTIVLQSAPGEGTAFTITLPMD